MQLKSIIEGLLFIAGDDGLEMKQLAQVLATDAETVQSQIEEMKDTYNDNEHGIEIVEVAGVYKFMTKPQLASYIQRLTESPDKSSLSQAAMETLAIIAYKQPITRAEIEDIRGVKTDRALQTLSAYALVKEEGRAQGTGRAILYGTTNEFMAHFGLRSLKELPPLPEEFEQIDEKEMDLFATNLHKNENRD